MKEELEERKRKDEGERNWEQKERMGFMNMINYPERERQGGGHIKNVMI